MTLKSYYYYIIPVTYYKIVLIIWSVMSHTAKYGIDCDTENNSKQENGHMFNH